MAKGGRWGRGTFWNGTAGFPSGLAGAISPQISTGSAAIIIAIVLLQLHGVFAKKL